MSATLVRQHLPAKPASAADKTRDVFKALSDVLDALRGVPAVEYKTFAVLAGDYPLYITTKVPMKVGRGGITAIGAWLAESDPSTAAYAGGVHWQLGREDGELKINGFQSLTTGTKYNVTIKIESER